jgi:hypothetical protein
MQILGPFLAFYPKHEFLISGRSSDLLSFLTPSHRMEIRTVAICQKNERAYSSGNCPGFTPGSLLINLLKKNRRPNRYRGKDRKKEMRNT